MKSLSILILLAAPIFVSAQVPATEEIKKVESGQFAFAKGEISVTFLDTVSRGFVKKQLDQLEFEIIEINISPISAKTAPNLPDSTLAELSKHPLIHSVDYSTSSFPEKAFQEMIQRRGSTEEEIVKLRKQFEKMNSTVYPKIKLQFNVTEKMAMTLVDEYADINFRLNMITPRTAIIKTEVGKEQEAMEKLKQLIYVKNTAFIGLIE